MVRFSKKVFLLTSLIAFFCLTVLGSLLFLCKPDDSPVKDYKPLAISNFISKYSTPDNYNNFIDDNYFTEDYQKYISVSDFCNITSTTLTKETNTLTLTFKDFETTINTSSEFLTNNTGVIVDLENTIKYVNGDVLLPLQEIAESLGFSTMDLVGGVKLSRPFETKRLIVKSSQPFTIDYAVDCQNVFKDIYFVQFETETQTKLAVKEIELQEGVIWVEPDIIVTLGDSLPENIVNETISSADDYTYYSWGGKVMGVDVYQDYLHTAIGQNNLEKITVAVIDTGIDLDHPMFEGRINTKYSHNFINPSLSADDDNGHGTHVAGTICDLTFDNVEILALKVLDARGAGYLGNILDALEYVEDQKQATIPTLKVVNMSLGGAHGIGSTGYNLYTDVIGRIYDLGVLTVVAAGNGVEVETPEGIVTVPVDASTHSPANIEKAITVGAIGKRSYNNELYIAPFSNFGELVDISAPGVGIYSAYPDKSYKSSSGTSMASPHIAGVVALLLSDKYTTYKNLEELEADLKFHTVDLGSPGRDDNFGVGMPNLSYAHYEKLEDISFSRTETKCTESFQLEITHSNTEPNVKILYTLDGTNPTATSTEYTGPITISSTTTVKAMACVLYEGNITKCSKVSSKTYLFEFSVSPAGVLTKYSGEDTDITVPSTVNGITVVAIGEHCFESQSITSVVLPETVTEIKYAAFSHCSQLVSVLAPKVTTVRASAFESCSSFTQLNDVYFPELTRIEDAAFLRCSSLTNAQLTKVTYIGEEAFFRCTDLISASFNNVTTIGIAAFMDCISLTSISFTNVKVVCSYAFIDCDLAFISLPNTTLVGYASFANNENLASANLPELIYVGNCCFEYTALNLISAPKVQIVGGYAFFGCTELTNVNFPVATKIEFNAFESSGLTQANFEKVEVIEQYAFYDCASLQSVNLPSVVKIKEFAFSYAEVLEELTLSNCIQFIDEYILYHSFNCTIYGYAGTIAQTYATEYQIPFVEIHFEYDSLIYTIYNNSEIHITGYNSSLANDVCLPDYIEGLPVTKICANAFNSATQLTSLVSSTIVEIEEGAFLTCTNLKTVNLHNAKIIAANAFNGCSSLENVNLPVIETVGVSAFASCDSLKSVVFGYSITTIGEQAFGFSAGTVNPDFIIYGYEDTVAKTYANDSGLTFYGRLSELTSFYFNYYTTAEGNKEVYIADVMPDIAGEIVLPRQFNGYTVSAVGPNAFEECTFITKIVIPDTYKILDSKAFFGCSLLSDINLENILTVYDYAFGYCFNLTDVDLTSATTLGAYAFIGCENLERVNIPNITNIKEGTFYNCYNLKTVEGSNITKIDTESFLSTFKLENINLSSVKSIGAGFTCAIKRIELKNINTLEDEALSGCYYVDKIIIYNTLQSIGIDVFPENTTFVIYGYEGTLIETYALENHLAFTPIQNLTIIKDLPVKFEIDNESANNKLTLSTTGFEIEYKWFKNTAYTYDGATEVLTTYNNYFEVDQFTVGSFYIFCILTDWVGETITSHITEVVVTYNVYYTVQASAVGHGTISPSGTMRVKENTKLLFLFEPDIGYEIEKVQINSRMYEAIPSFTMAKLTNDLTVIVYFKIIQVTISTSTDGNGTVSPSGNHLVDYGSPQTFNFIPNEGYEVDKIFVDGKTINQTSNSYTFLYPTRDYTLYVTFKLKTYVVNIISNGADVTPDGQITVQHGEDLDISFSNNPEYKIVSIVINGEQTLNESTKACQLQNITHNQEVVVNTIIHPYYINITTGENGRVENPSIKLEYNDDVTVNFIPDTGYEVSKLIVDGEEVAPTQRYSFVNVAADHNIAVEFKKIECAISFNHGEFDIVEGSDGNVVEYGESKVFTIVPKLFYKITGVFVNGEPVELLEGNKIALSNINRDFNIQVSLRKDVDLEIIVFLTIGVGTVAILVTTMFVARKIKLRRRHRTNLTSMVHSSSSGLKEVVIKEEYLTDEKPARKPRITTPKTTAGTKTSTQKTTTKTSTKATEKKTSTTKTTKQSTETNKTKTDKK